MALTHARPTRRWTFALIAAFLAVALAGCVGPSDEAPSTDASGYTPVTNWGHIHGLAVNAERPNELYAATHHGLIRGVDDGNWSRVGSTTDDLMGFSMHPTDGDVFWSSGHPANPSRDHFNLGVRKSTDGGFTWETIALEGVDFHAMTVSPADPENLWGYYKGEVYHSTDGGYNWSVVAGEGLPGIFSLSADPEAPATVYATTQEGVLRSTDGGTTWTGFVPRVATAFVKSPADPSVAYLAGTDGVARSGDGGATWTGLPLDTGDDTIGYIALHPDDPDTAYVATFNSAIHKTTDAGETWTRIKAAS